MIEEIRNNIDIEIRMLREIDSFTQSAEHSNPRDKKLIFEMVRSLRERIKIINRSTPHILKQVSIARQLPRGEVQGQDEKVETIRFGNYGPKVTLSSRDKKAYLDELNISESLIKKLMKKSLIGKEKPGSYKRPNFYSRLANKYFLKIAETQIKRGNFKSMSLDLRRSNLNILTATYISMMFFSIMIAFFGGAFASFFLTFIKFSFEFPFISAHSGDFLIRFVKLSWLIVAVPLLTGIMFYIYPGSEKKSLAKKIEQELPFVVIHMGSISGSGIEPIEIFKIIGLSKEYKYTGKEIRKILNQTNIYGYDLTNSLRNVGRATPSTKLAELLNGISVTINSGGDIKTFLEKRSDSLLLEYRLDREKSNKAAETFMDIYISIVIATPMILLLLLVMIAVSGIGIGFGIGEMSLLIIGIVSLVNIVFLGFLHLKQPGY